MVSAGQQKEDWGGHRSFGVASVVQHCMLIPAVSTECTYVRVSESEDECLRVRAHVVEVVVVAAAVVVMVVEEAVVVVPTVVVVLVQEQWWWWQCVWQLTHVPTCCKWCDVMRGHLGSTHIHRETTRFCSTSHWIHTKTCVCPCAIKTCIM
jgi:hypothetical protein